MLLLLDDWRHFGVNLCSIREQLDFSSPSGQLALTCLAAVATLEKQLIAERIRTSLAAKKIAAQASGSDWRCGRPNVITDELIAQVIELRSRGLSIRAIERQLARKAGRSTIARILKGRPIKAGKNGGEVA